MKVAILGYGTVGKKLYDLLKDKYDVTRILNDQVNDNLFTCSMDDVLKTNPDTIFECLPNIPIAFEYQMQVLNNGINLISSNKAMIQSHYKELIEAANRHNVILSFEAAVAGGIPFLHTIIDTKKHDDIKGIRGIMNGTTNYILDSVFNRNVSYEEALNTAIKLGYAEANYSSDVDGDDVAYKVSLSMSLAFNTYVEKNAIVKYGIRYLNDKVLDYARTNNYVIKLIGYGDKENAFVLPIFLPKDNLFANVNSNYNCVEILSDNQDSIKLIGQGAGGLPTADAMVSDLIRPFESLSTDNTLNITNSKKFRFLLSDGSDVKLTDNIKVSDLKDIVKEHCFVGGIYD